MVPASPLTSTESAGSRQVIAAAVRSEYDFISVSDSSLPGVLYRR